MIFHQYFFIHTECPKNYRKSVLHLQYTQADAVKICGKFWDTQYSRFVMNIMKASVLVNEVNARGK